MTRPSSLDLGHTPRTASRSALQITNSPNLIPTLGAPVTPNTKLPRYEPNGYWIAGRQRRAFLSHLEQWSQNYDSSPHFHGKLSLSPLNPQRQEKVELGQPVICILTDTRFIDARRKIIIRLFPPPKTISHMDQASNMHHRHDSMDLLEEDRLGLSQRMRSSVPTSESQERVSDHDHGSVATGPYKLFVRCGANYISAREYFSKLYFDHLPSKKPKLKSTTKAWERTFIKKSKLLGHPPQPDDTITIRPLFHPFKRLPPELRDMILTTATGLSKHYNLCYDGHYSPYRLKKGSNAISLSTMFQISKKINEDLIPYVYHSTDFHFGLTGFTNFLWHAGPVNRPEIRRLTFHFGKLALLHCIRWLAPDYIFDLLEPPVITNPRSLQYFWRCQIQDLAKEVHLHTVTIDVKYIPITDLAMVVRILRCAFGSVRRVRLVETDRNGELQELSMEMKESVKLRSEATWRQMCLDYWAQHKAHQYFYKFELLPLAEEEFQTLMDRDKEHLDC